MPKSYEASTELSLLLFGSSAGEVIPGLARHGLQQLIQMLLAALPRG